jgi:septal ring factor EnvC (AmiA/AmiB activator)
MFGYMKRIWLGAACAVAVLSAAAPAWCQDAATEQRLNELSGKIEEAFVSLEAMRKTLDNVQREIRQLQEQQSSPKPDYASNEDLKRLSDAVREIDRKRLEDYEKIRVQIEKLGKSLSATLTTPAASKRTETAPERSAKPEAGFEYVVQKNDTISLIIKNCRERNIKVTQDQILKANRV